MSPEKHEKIFRYFLLFLIIGPIAKEAYDLEQRAQVSTEAVQYDGDGFSMIVPVGSTPVKVKRETEKLNGQQVTKNWYVFRNENEKVGYSIAVADSPDPWGGLEEAVKGGVTLGLDPGYHVTNSTSRFGTQPAACAESDGTREGNHFVGKMCAAFSANRKRMWMVFAFGSGLPQQAEEFMDSFVVHEP